MIYIKLLSSVLVLEAAAAGLLLLMKKTAFGKAGECFKQLICGVVFGLVAVTGTEYGVNYQGATTNIRDAAPILAGLVFGGPAGIIAGVIGGVERWFATLWGAGEYTRIACSVSTFLSGFYAAGIRKYLTGGRTTYWGTGFAAGCVMEAFHLLMVFLTHLSDASQAISIVKLLAFPMISMTAAAVAAGILISGLILGDREDPDRSKRHISEKMRVVLLLVFVVCFAAVTFLTTLFQNRMARRDAQNVMKISGIDVEESLIKDIDENLLKDARIIAAMNNKSENRDLADLARYYGLKEINIVDENGIIVQSTNEDFVGYDMDSGAQSRSFLVLLHGAREIVGLLENIAYAPDDPSMARKYAGVAMKSGGFVQIGVDAETLDKRMSEALKDLTVNRHIRYRGYFMIADRNGRIVSNGTGSETKTLQETGITSEIYKDEDRLHTCSVKGEQSYVMSSLSEGYYIISVLPVSEAMESRDMILCLLILTQMLIYAAVYVLVYKVLERNVLNPIHSLNDGLGRIIGGDLDEVVNERSSLEFDSLSDDINMTVGTLKKYISEAEERIEKELELAKEIQRSALPSVFPPFPEERSFDIFATMDPARSVGGDFYDFYMLGGNRLAFIAADVSGKGIPAAMFMMTAKTMIKNFAESGMALSEVFATANQKLCEENDAEMFVTAWMGILELDTGRVTYVNAGHNPPVVQRGNTGCEYLRTRPGFVLAGMEGIRYREGELLLEPGDRIFLYTDGAPEAVDPDLVQYGEDRLLDYMNTHRNESPDQVLPGLREDIGRFSNGAEQFDDITMLEVHYHGKTGE